MNLTVDIGNTYTKVRVFKDEDVVYQSFKGNYSAEDVETIVEDWGINKAIISTVGNNKLEIKTYLEECKVRVVEFSNDMKLPIRILYATPHTLGQDRIAAAIGARQLSGGGRLLVMDLGTCNTYDVVLDNSFLGGNIAPGYKMRLDAMHHYTKRLPQLDVENKDHERIGNDTQSALQGGAYYGIIYEIEGIYRQTLKQYEDLKLFITGGAAQYFVGKLNIPYTYEPDLVHIGLNKILDFTDANKL